MTSPEDLFAALLTAEPTRPFVTCYDEASGDRSELSVRSLANWVAKTHFLLTDELGLGAGDIAFIALPAHWISVPAVLGCLTAGLSITDSATAASVGFVQPSSAAAAAGIADVYAVRPDSAATGFGDTIPPGVGDFVTAVRPQADAWGGVRFGATADDPCLAGRSRAEVVTWARQRAAELGFATRARVLTTRDWSGPSDWVDTLLAPLAVGGSVVYLRNATDDAVVQRRISQERATARV